MFPSTISNLESTKQSENNHSDRLNSLWRKNIFQHGATCQLSTAQHSTIRLCISVLSSSGERALTRLSSVQTCLVLPEPPYRHAKCSEQERFGFYFMGVENKPDIFYIYSPHPVSLMSYLCTERDVILPWWHIYLLTHRWKHTATKKWVLGPTPSLPWHSRNHCTDLMLSISLNKVIFDTVKKLLLWKVNISCIISKIFPSVLFFENCERKYRLILIISEFYIHWFVPTRVKMLRHIRLNMKPPKTTEAVLQRLWDSPLSWSFPRPCNAL